MTQHRKPALIAWPVFFVLSSASGLYFLVSLALLPSDSEKGFSLPRLAILASMLLVIMGLAALFLFFWRNPSWRSHWLKVSGAETFVFASLLLSAGLILLPQTLLDLLRSLYLNSEIFLYSVYFTRLMPLFNWFSLTGLLLAITVLVSGPRRVLSEDRAFRLWPWLWLVLALVAGWVAWTRIGLYPDKIGSWGIPTVPLLEWQIWLALLATFVFAFVLAGIKPGKRTDLWISLAIWALAALLWAGHPFVPGYFATPGREPNFETYPFSDGATYDQFAQSILIGNGFMGDAIPHRPLYIVFLAGLHLLAGQEYLDVILLQQLILAVFPVLIYLLGKELHSRPAGLLAALFVILREITAIRAAPFTDNISYTKLYFSEIPTAICLCAFTLFAIRWMKTLYSGNRTSFPVSALAAGGFLGMAMLIRTQSLSVLPPVLLIAWFVSRKRGWGSLLRGCVFLILGIVLVITPWLWRNWPIAQGFAFDNADSQTMVLAQRYNNISFNTPILREPGETEAHYSSRLVRMAIQGMLRDPRGAAWAVANHFLNNEISNLFLLPVRFKIIDPRELVWPAFAFWQDWAGSLTFAQVLMVLANLSLLAAGLAGAVQRNGAIGWTPLLVNLAYNFSTAIFRSSGGRFLLPVDWAVILIYALGWAQVFSWGWALLGRPVTGGWMETPSVETAMGPEKNRFALVSLVGIAAAFLLVGMSLPLSEHLFPARYPQETQAQMAQVFLRELPEESSGSPDSTAAALNSALQQPGVVLLRGRVLYPRHYSAGEDEPKTAKTGYAGLPYARLVFFLVGSQNGLVVLPLDQPEVDFPNLADVYVLGCSEKNMVLAKAVLVMHEQPALYGAVEPNCTTK